MMAILPSGPATSRLARLGAVLVAALGLVVGAPRPAEATRLGSAELFFSFDGDRSGPCVTVSEPADIAAWDDNVLCGSLLPEAARWSHNGPLDGMRCTAILEPADPDTWHDNYLCVPMAAPVGFVWSHRGAPRLNRRAACATWQEPADPATWNDNVLCAVPLTGFEARLLETIVPARQTVGLSRQEAAAREEAARQEGRREGREEARQAAREEAATREAELRRALEEERQARMIAQRQLQEERLERQRLEAVRPNVYDRERRNVIIRRE